MYRTKKGLETNKELPKANVLKNEQAKSALAELKSGFYLEQNVLWDTRMVAFVISFEGRYLFFFGELKHEPKYVETETSARPTVLFLWRKAIIR